MKSFQGRGGEGTAGGLQRASQRVIDRPEERAEVSKVSTSASGSVPRGHGPHCGRVPQLLKFTCSWGIYQRFEGGRTNV